MYETIIHALETISGSGFAPKCYLIQEEPNKLMVFNDMKELGYKMIDRKKGLDFDHCKLLLQKLADFHATSMVFLRENKEPLEELNQGMSTDPILVEFVFKSYLMRLIEEAEQWKEPEFEGLVGKLKAVLVKIKEGLECPPVFKCYFCYLRKTTWKFTRCP